MKIENAVKETKPPQYDPFRQMLQWHHHVYAWVSFNYLPVRGTDEPDDEGTRIFPPQEPNYGFGCDDIAQVLKQSDANQFGAGPEEAQPNLCRR